MDEIKKREVVERYIEAYNRFDVDGMLSLMTEDVRFENVSNGTVTAAASGSDELRALAVSAAALFSEREQRVTGMRFANGVAIADIAYRGVLAIDIAGGPAAGSVLELVGESEFRFDDDRISGIIDRS